MAVYRLLVRSLATRGRLISLGLLGLLGVTVGIALGASHPFDPLDSGTHFIDAFGLSVLVPVTTLVFSSAALGDATDDGTLVYLWLRPVRRSRLVLAAFAASLTICLPLIGIPLVVAAAFVNGGPELVSGTAMAAAVSVVAYCAPVHRAGAFASAVPCRGVWRTSCCGRGSSHGRESRPDGSPALLLPVDPVRVHRRRASVGHVLTRGRHHRAARRGGDCAGVRHPPPQRPRRRLGLRLRSVASLPPFRRVDRRRRRRRPCRPTSKLLGRAGLRRSLCPGPPPGKPNNIAWTTPVRQRT